MFWEKKKKGKKKNRKRRRSLLIETSNGFRLGFPLPSSHLIM